MEDKKALTILLKLLRKNVLNAEETAAVKSAIGLFSWTTLAKSRIKQIKAKREKSLES